MPPKSHIKFSEDDDSVGTPIAQPQQDKKRPLDEPTLQSSKKQKSQRGFKINGQSEDSSSSKKLSGSFFSNKLNGKVRSDSSSASDSPSSQDNLTPDSTSESSPLPSETKQKSANKSASARKQNLRKENTVKFFDSEDEADIINGTSEEEDSEDEENRKKFSSVKSLADHRLTASDDSKDKLFKAREKLKNKLFEIRKTLPMYQARKEVIEHIMENETTILLGETGSGKSTQLPQLLYEAAREESLKNPKDKTKKTNESTKHQFLQKIAITQPRRVAAINLATRVCEEMGQELGFKVGYSVRFQSVDIRSTNSYIKYLTDGMLLRELMINPTLSNYNTVILDEAHERTLLTDLSMGLLKQLQKDRRNTKNPLKLVIMSATLDAERFSKFFDNADILFVEGKTYPVQRFYLNQPQDDAIDTMIQAACQINITEPTGDILAFLAGQEDIEKVVERINELAPLLPKEAPLLVAIPLYASLPNSAQQLAFRKLSTAGRPKRKIIVATNIAETSVTVPGVRYVIDSGVRKVKVYNPDTGIDSLILTPISQAAASQRMGRAGREFPGKCFRLYTEDFYNTEMRPQTEAEITRTDISSAILLLKQAGVDDILSFDWVESPGTNAIKSGLLKLYGLKALDDNGKITKLGEQMVLLPVAPQLAACLLQAVHLGGIRLLSTVLDVAACLSVENLLMNPRADQRDEVNEHRKQNFPNAMEWGDLVMLKEMFDMYLGIDSSTEKRAWCKQICLNKRAMDNVLKVREQLCNYMKGILGFKSESSSGRRRNSKKNKKNKKIQEDVEMNDYDGEEFEPDELESNIDGQFDIALLLKCFLHGYISFTALGLPDRQYRSTMNGQLLTIHPSSMLFGQKREAIMYMNFVKTMKDYARCVSPIKIEWLHEIAPHILQE